MSIRVLKAGLLTSLQDRGRHGHASLGVGSAGPIDEVSFRLANALVGNPSDTAGLELTLVGPRLRFDHDTVIALTGAEFATTIDATPVETWRPIRIAAGSVLDCGRASRGARGYLAIARGIAIEPVLGSASTDVNARLGPLDGRALRDGDLLQIADDACGQSRALRNKSKFDWSLDPKPWFDPDPRRPIRLIHGAHFDALDQSSRASMFNDSFRIGAHSNRVGLRLEGPELVLERAVEIISEPVAFGTVQLPPDGRPIALMVEHPSTGGYPRIGQIAAIDLPRLAQRRAGDTVCFAEITLDEAQTSYLHRERELDRLIHAVTMRVRGNA